MARVCRQGFDCVRTFSCAIGLVVAQCRGQQAFRGRGRRAPSPMEEPSGQRQRDTRCIFRFLGRYSFSRIHPKNEKREKPKNLSTLIDPVEYRNQVVKETLSCDPKVPVIEVGDELGHHQAIVGDQPTRVL